MSGNQHNPGTKQNNLTNGVANTQTKQTNGNATNVSLSVWVIIPLAVTADRVGHTFGIDAGGYGGERDADSPYAACERDPGSDGETRDGTTGWRCRKRRRRALPSIH